MERGSVYRRCGCRDEATGRLLGACCPGLRSREHGSWYFSADLPSAAGERHRAREVAVPFSADTLAYARRLALAEGRHVDERRALAGLLDRSYGASE